MIPERSPGSYPKISVALPIRNEAAFIARTIKYLQDQDYPVDKLEILVVVGDSHDNTVEWEIGYGKDRGAPIRWIFSQ